VGTNISEEPIASIFRMEAVLTYQTRYYYNPEDSGTNLYCH